MHQQPHSLFHFCIESHNQIQVTLEAIVVEWEYSTAVLRDTSDFVDLF